MKPLFEVVKKKVALSRIGRINIFPSSHKYIKTPTILIPINKGLVKDIKFIIEFEDDDLFKINDEIFLKETFLHQKFKNKGFIYTHSGLLENFIDILKNNIEHFSEEIVIPIIPFNIPTTSISKDFTRERIKEHITIISSIVKEFSDISFGISIKLFEFPEFFSLYSNLIRNHSNITILEFTDLFDNLNNYRNILSIIFNLKENFSRNLILMVSGKIYPKFFPLLVYLGFDLIDYSQALYLSSENFYDTLETLIPFNKLKYLPCSCPACRGGLKDHLKEENFSNILYLLCLHNITFARNYMNKIKQYLQFEDYRTFVEKSCLNDLRMISTLKILDKDFFPLLKSETPTYQKRIKVSSLGPSSYYRPDFQEFRQRVVQTFNPDSNITVIILLPCSAKKPYSSSRSHQKFFEIIKKFPDFPYFQEIILTSPLGAIPRQLEEIYPVNSYDISVTGDWDFEEIKLSSEMLISLLRKFEAGVPIISHLSGDYLKIIDAAKPRIEQHVYCTEVENKVTSKNSLDSLYSLIKEHHLDHIDYQKSEFFPKMAKTKINKLIKMLDYQLGVGWGEKIFNAQFSMKKNIKANRLEIFEGTSNQKLFWVENDTGVFHYTLKGAQKIHSLGTTSNIVVFDGYKLQGNTLFRPGILEFSPNIIPNEQVFVLSKDKNDVIAVGKALVSSNFIKKSNSGRIIRIHEKA